MLEIKGLAAKCIMLGALFTPFSGAASIKVNVHQLDNWWWTAPATPVIELGVVNDGEQRVGCRVELAVTTDMHRPVCTMAQQVAVSPSDSAVVSFKFN